MSKLLKMIEARNAAWEAAKSFLEQREDKDGLLSAEDRKTYDEMEERVKAYNEQIDRLQAMEAMDRELEKPMTKPLVGTPENNNGEPKTGIKSEAYKKAMLDAFRSKFRRISDVLQEGVKEDGGYLVPEEYDSRMIDVMEENNIMRQLATSFPTSGEHKINIAGSKPAAAWIDEGEELKFQDAKFSQIMLDAHKLHVAVKVTEELLNDSAFNLETYLINSFGKALGNKEEDAFLNGSGTGCPTGIFADKGGGTLAKTLTAAITSDDLIDLEYSLKRPYRKNAVFILNDKVIASIRKLKYAENKEYIWQPSFQTGEPDRLLGYPVYTSAYAPEDKIAFGEMSYYNIGDRGQRAFQELLELFAGNGMVGFLAKERVDGKVVLPEAIQILQLKAETPAAKS